MSFYNFSVPYMDPIKAEKLQAMKSYRKGQFVYNLLPHSLFALTCSFLCCFPFWFASLSSYMKCLFISLSLPNIWSSFFNPNCLFVVVNIIIVFLVGESKLLDASDSSSPVADIYSEYVERSQSLKRQQESRLQEKKEESKLEAYKEEMNLKDELNIIKSADEDQEVKSKDDEVDDEFEDCRDQEDVDITNIAEEDERDGEDEDEESGLPAEELNKRVEEFIARVNKQRRLEELVYGEKMSYN